MESLLLILAATIVIGKAALFGLYVALHVIGAGLLLLVIFHLLKSP